MAIIEYNILYFKNKLQFPFLKCVKNYFNMKNYILLSINFVEIKYSFSKIIYIYINIKLFKNYCVTHHICIFIY